MERRGAPRLGVGVDVRDVGVPDRHTLPALVVRAHGAGAAKPLRHRGAPALGSVASSTRREVATLRNGTGRTTARAGNRTNYAVLSGVTDAALLADDPHRPGTEILEMTLRMLWMHAYDNSEGVEVLTVC